ncbi:NAD(P)-dependent alcohol dehydrogenase [Hamadaea tsunoensis]|uniref:NAD(P)-dependent alcohol dehydrogenase n=1 Tax=Hamadaea tsunoensis TaxID=53368 RepID=UPI0004279CD3|nr:NAD(P)-dependent alcohol dehydrogenase [Hamadaea tsunoensis]
MKAIAQRTYGEARVLELTDVPKPVPRPGEVLLEVRAAGVDMGVWHVMAGRPYLGRLAFGLFKPHQPVRGMEVAGVVAAVGDQVTEFRPGDRVFGTGKGTFAEFSTAAPKRLARIPENVGFAQAAVSAISGVTALQALRAAPDAATVLVIGAGGGVGSFAVQMAKARGMRVTGVCSTGKVEFVRGLGADEVVDYTRSAPGEDLGGGTYDLILDIAGNRPLSVLRGALHPHGTLVIVGGEGGTSFFGGMSRNMVAAARSSRKGQRFTGLLSRTNARDLAELADAMADGRLVPAVDTAYPLAEAVRAVEHLRSGRAHGKVVLIPNAGSGA